MMITLVIIIKEEKMFRVMMLVNYFGKHEAWNSTHLDLFAHKFTVFSCFQLLSAGCVVQEHKFEK